MSETPPPEQRKQHDEATLVGRDKASPETVEHLNSLRTEIDDPEAAVAVAILHAQCNGDHPDYERPPAEEPFGQWHRELAVEPPTKVSTTTSSLTVDVTLSAFEFYDGDASVVVSAIPIDTDGFPTGDTQESAPETLTTTGTAEFSLDSLDPATTHRVRARADAPHATGSDTEHSEAVEVTTDKSA